LSPNLTASRKQYSSEEKIRIVLDGVRGEDSIDNLCRREGISQRTRSFHRKSQMVGLNTLGTWCYPAVQDCIGTDSTKY